MSDPNENDPQDVPHPEIVDDASIPENWVECDLPNYEWDWSDEYDDHGN